MFRIFSATGQTSTGPSIFTPPKGFKWIIHNAYGDVVSGTAAGTRRIKALRAIQGATTVLGDQLFDTGTSTVVSTTAAAQLTETDASGQTNKNIQNVPVTIGWNDAIVIAPTLVGADTYDYYLTVDELEQ